MAMSLFFSTIILLRLVNLYHSYWEICINLFHNLNKVNMLFLLYCNLIHFTLTKQSILYYYCNILHQQELMYYYLHEMNISYIYSILIIHLYQVVTFIYLSAFWHSNDIRLFILFFFFQKSQVNISYRQYFINISLVKCLIISFTYHYYILIFINKFM